MLGASLLVGTSVAGTASAQSNEWLLLPIANEGEASSLAYEARTHLAAAGIELLDDEGATLAFEQDVSAPARSLSQSDIDQWANRSRSALQALAQADYDTAREELLEAQRVAQHATEELNREADRARQVLDTCLFMARTFLETGERSEALRQVRACRVLVPELEPRRHRHPPEIHELLDRVDSENSGSDLRVSSSPSGCIVRINGVAQGETPFTVQNVARGDYRLQVECTEETRGRVHRVRIGEGSTSIHVDTRFDAMVASWPIVFATPGFDAAQGAVQIAYLMNRTVVVVMRDDTSFHFLRVEPDGRVVEVRTTANNLEAAAVALKNGRGVDLRRDTPRPIEERRIDPRTSRFTPEQVADASTEIHVDDETAEVPAQDTALPEWRRWAGVAALLVGGGGMGLSAFFHFDRQRIGDGYALIETSSSAGFLENQRLWLNESLTPAAISAFAGAAVMSIGAGLLVPRREKVEWWAWAIGGMGVAVAASSLIPILTRPGCSDPSNPDDPGIVSDSRSVRSDCIERDMAASRATIIGAAALPLIAVPISALIQSGRRGEGSASRTLLPSLLVSTHQFTLTLQGTL